VCIDIRQGDLARRYRFDSRTADYLVCGRCGVYVAAVVEEEGRAHAVIMVRALDDGELFTQAAVPMDFGGETPQERTARRRRTWTPAMFERSDA
jgi:hypothetical protein